MSFYNLQSRHPFITTILTDSYHLSGPAGLARRSTFDLVKKVASWGCQMQSVIIEFSGASTVRPTDHHKIVNTHHLGRQGWFKVIIWVATKPSPETWRVFLLRSVLIEFGKMGDIQF